MYYKCTVGNFHTAYLCCIFIHLLININFQAVFKSDCAGVGYFDAVF